MKVNLVIRHKPVKCENPDCIYGGEASIGHICLDLLPQSNLYAGEWYCFHPECFAAFVLSERMEESLLRTLREAHKVEQPEEQGIRT